SMAIAILVGSIAGYYGGMIDTILMRFSEIFLVMPSFLFLIVFLKVALTVRVAGFGLGIVILVLGIIGWAGDSRAIRAEFMRLKEFEFVTAARCLGASNRRIISNHILPNVLHLIIVLMTASIATNIIIEAGLSFLGFSDPNIITWGRMISLSMEAIRGAWWQGVFPGLAIVLTVLGFNLLGDGLRDALDPRLRE
ncbi:MAG: ABC transporter permease, partial [Candidatus Bathyarchaeota archaeon]|nr:ABC transporter permease [Candidatus Bathyarchaeota archaeon]